MHLEAPNFKASWQSKISDCPEMIVDPNLKPQLQLQIVMAPWSRLMLCIFLGLPGALVITTKSSDQEVLVSELSVAILFDLIA